jgi:hypothetical protein
MKEVMIKVVRFLVACSAHFLVLHSQKGHIWSGLLDTLSLSPFLEDKLFSSNCGAITNPFLGFRGE